MINAFFDYLGLQNICNVGDYFPENSHLLGDGAYTLQKHVIVPYKNNRHLNERQVNFNRCHSRAHLVIERVIGLLKMRWRRLLRKLPMLRVDLIPSLIMACCVLHNICIIRGDEFNFRAYREHRIPILRNNTVSIASKNAGNRKRNDISNLLFQNR